MTKAQSLRHDAKVLDREAARLRRMAQRKAVRGEVFTAETLTISAMRHERMAAQFRCDATAHEID
jgi:hypothetical protein